MLPQLEWAQSKGYPVLVMNPNFNTDPETSAPIPKSETMGKHALNVWITYVLNSGFEKVHVIAHAKGGQCLKEIQQELSKYSSSKHKFYSQVGKIALTDSEVISKDELNKA